MGKAYQGNRKGNRPAREPFRVAPIAAAIIAVALGWVWLLARVVPKVPWELVAYGRYLPTKTDWGTNLYVGEGMNASVAVSEMSNGVRQFSC